MTNFWVEWTTKDFLIRIYNGDKVDLMANQPVEVSRNLSDCISMAHQNHLLSWVPAKAR